MGWDALTVGAKVMPTLDQSLLKKTFSRCPTQISAPVTSLCAIVSPDNSPRFVDVRPEPDCAINECFPNVIGKIQKDGGAILYGWSISEWPRILVEAEHHAIWVNGDVAVDITPRVAPTRRILFLPDPARSYDFDTGRRLMNVHLSMDEFPLSSEIYRCLRVLAALSGG